MIINHKQDDNLYFGLHLFFFKLKPRLIDIDWNWKTETSPTRLPFERGNATSVPRHCQLLGRPNCYLLPFLQNAVIYVFLLLCFFSPATIPKLSRDRCTRNLARMCVLVYRKYIRNLEKVKKPGHDEEKTSKFRWNFVIGFHIFAQCEETVKV